MKLVIKARKNHMTHQLCSCSWNARDQSRLLSVWFGEEVKRRFEALWRRKLEMHRFTFGNVELILVWSIQQHGKTNTNFFLFLQPLENDTRNETTISLHLSCCGHKDMLAACIKNLTYFLFFFFPVCSSTLKIIRFLFFTHFPPPLTFQLAVKTTFLSTHTCKGKWPVWRVTKTYIPNHFNMSANSSTTV